MGLLQKASLVITPNAVKAGKLYSVIPNDGTGDLDVVRATSATRVNEQGLIEIPRTNLLLRSEEFDNSAWIKSASTIIANATISPNGTMTADKLVENNTNENHYVIQNTGSLVIGNTYFVSVYLKAGERNRGRLRVIGAFAIETAFNLQDGTASEANAIIQNMGNGWYKIGFSFVANATTMGTVVFLSNSTTGNSGFNYTYLGDNTSGIFVWGAQLEVGNVATEYIPTTSVIRTKFAGITQDGGSASNIARLDYTNGSCPSILVEPQRTNLLLRSQEFDNTFWNKEAVTVIANATTAPNGNLNADKIIATATNSNHVIYNSSISFVSSQSYTFSYYAKSAEYTKTAIRIGGPGYSIVCRAEINLSNGTIIYQQGFTSLQVQSVGNGWYRIQGTFVSASDIAANIQPLSDSYSVVYDNYTFLGDGTSGIYIWGAQLEVGSNATSYIPTTTSSVTRNADVISKSGISSLIGQTEGTIFCEFISNDGKNWNTTIFSVNSLTATERIRLGYNNIPAQPSGGYLNLAIRSGNIVVVDINAGNLIPIKGQNYKVCVTYSQTAQKIFVNGTLVTTRTGSYTQPGEMNSTQLGSLSNGFISNTSFNSALIFKNALTDQQAIQLTTL